MNFKNNPEDLRKFVELRCKGLNLQDILSRLYYVFPCNAMTYADNGEYSITFGHDCFALEYIDKFNHKKTGGLKFAGFKWIYFDQFNNTMSFDRQRAEDQIAIAKLFGYKPGWEDE